MTSPLRNVNGGETSPKGRKPAVHVFAKKDIPGRTREQFQRCQGMRGVLEEQEGVNRTRVNQWAGRGRGPRAYGLGGQT